MNDSLAVAAPSAAGASDPVRDEIRARVLQAIADSRTPGLHFVGHFMGTSWDDITPAHARLSIETGAHSTDADGEANLNMVTTLVDMALANAIRARLSMDTGMRLGTVSLHIAFTGVPLRGRLDAVAHCEGWVEGALTRQGIAHCRLTAAGRVACIASGTFMELPPPVGVTLAALPWQPGGRPPGTPIAVRDLDARERAVWKRVSEVIERADARTSFVEHLFAQFPVQDGVGRAHCRMPMGLHSGNRVGHAQGGVTFALAARTAAAAAPPGHRLVEASAWYLSPGEGRSLKAVSKVSRAGRRLSVVDTLVSGKGGSRTLEMVSTHCAYDIDDANALNDTNEIAGTTPAG
jgi:acyl-coenzyme A thioesterase PaaI-like protein